MLFSNSSKNETKAVNEVIFRIDYDPYMVTILNISIIEGIPVS